MSSDLARRCHSVLHDQFEELRPIRATYLGEGCDSVAVEVNGKFVFRFPKHADVEQQVFIEAQLLPALARAGPLPIPVFSFFGKPTPVFPRHFAGYRKLPPPMHLAPVIGNFLSSLHGYPIERAEAVGVPRRSLAALIEEIRPTRSMISRPWRRWHHKHRSQCSATIFAPRQVLHRQRAYWCTTISLPSTSSWTMPLTVSPA